MPYTYPQAFYGTNSCGIQSLNVYWGLFLSLFLEVSELNRLCGYLN